MVAKKYFLEENVSVRHLKASSFLVIFVFILGQIPSSAASLDAQLSGVTIFGNMGAGTNSEFNESYISSYSPNAKNIPIEDRCTSIWKTSGYATQCTVERAAMLIEKYQQNVSYVTGLSSCDESTEIPCVKSVSIVGPTGEKFSLKKVSELQENLSWQGNESIRLDKSRPIATIWEAEINGVKKKFLLRASKSRATFQLKTTKLQINLIPFETPPLSMFPAWVNPPHNAYNAAPFQINGIACPRTSVWHDENSCAVWSEFPENTKASISIKTNGGQLGSINGRIYRPEFKVTKGDNFNELEMTGLPMEVPGVYVSDLGKAFRFIQINGWAIDSSITRTFENLRTFTSDSTNITRSEWNFTLTDSYNFDLSLTQQRRVSTCYASAVSLKPSVGAFMTTNALMGQANPPKFDGKNMTYKLSGFHKKADGSTFSGYYQMIIDAKLARCIYNLKDKALQAKVSITDNGGEVQRAFTQTLKEDVKTGKVYFEVAGFHFSDPTIKVQLTN